MKSESQFGFVSIWNHYCISLVSLNTIQESLESASREKRERCTFICHLSSLTFIFHFSPSTILTNFPSLHRRRCCLRRSLRSRRRNLRQIHRLRRPKSRRRWGK